MLVDFYNKFHKGIRPQDRVITAKNFTYRIVISILKQTVKKRKKLKILDYGCGAGTLSFFLASADNYVIGIDISSAAVKTAKESARLMGFDKQVMFYTLNSGRSKIKNLKFDLITCIEVIEHIKNDKALISYLSRHLKRSGLLIISTPSIKAPLHRLGLTKHFDLRVGHLKRYHTQELIKTVEDVNLKVVNVIKKEGIIRNSLYIFPLLGKLIRFIKGPISDITTFLDNLTLLLLGESDIFIVAKKQ